MSTERSGIRLHHPPQLDPWHPSHRPNCRPSPQLPPQDNGSISITEFIKRAGRLPTGDAAPPPEEIDRCQKAFEEGKRADGPLAAIRQSERSQKTRRRRAPKPDADPGMFGNMFNFAGWGSPSTSSSAQSVQSVEVAVSATSDSPAQDRQSVA